MCKINTYIYFHYDQLRTTCLSNNKNVISALGIFELKLVDCSRN